MVNFEPSCPRTVALLCPICNQLIITGNRFNTHDCDVYLSVFVLFVCLFFMYSFHKLAHISHIPLSFQVYTQLFRVFLVLIRLNSDAILGQNTSGIITKLSLKSSIVFDNVHIKTSPCLYIKIELSEFLKQVLLNAGRNIQISQFRQKMNDKQQKYEEERRCFTSQAHGLNCFISRQIVLICSSLDCNKLEMSHSKLMFIWSRLIQCL